MADVRNRPDSYSPLVHEVIFAVGDRLFDIPSHEFLQSISVTLKSAGAWTGQIVLFDQDGDFLENLILLAGRNRRVLFRWGWDDGRGIEQFPLYEGGVTVYTPSFTPEGVTLTLDLVPAPVLESVLTKTTESFPEGLLCSEIVREIADKNNWKHAVGNRDTIEVTKGKLEKPLSFKDESPLKFIRDKIEKESVNSDDKAVRFFFDRLGVMHFHSDLFLVKKDTDRHFAASYQFARDVMGEVIRFAPKDTSIFGALYGSADSEYTALDSLGGSATKEDATQAAGLNGTRNEVIQDSAFQTHLPTGTKTKINLIARAPEEPRRMAAARHTRLRNFVYVADLEVRGTHAVEILDHINVDYIKRNGQSHYLSGAFHVHGIKHEVSTSGWTTEMELTRSGTKPPTPRGSGAPKQEIDKEIAGSETSETQRSGDAAGRFGRRIPAGAREQHSVQTEA